MRRVGINLQHCYGIKALNYEFDFAQVSAYAIYAPNGAMKSSFALTFQDAQRNQPTSDRVFPERSTIREITDEAGLPIEGERVLVVLSYDDKFWPTERTCSLLVNPALRDEYTKLHEEVDKAKAVFLDALRAQSKFKGDIEAEVSSAIMPAANQFMHALRRIRPEVSEQDDMPWKDIPYDKVFDQKNLDAIKKAGIDASLGDYVKRYDQLLASSNFFKKGVFDYYHAGEIAKTLTKNGFFRAKHTVHLNNGTDSEKIQSEDDLEALVQKEKDAILKDQKLRDEFEKIAGILNKNAGIRDFTDFLMNNPRVVAQLTNVAKFRQEVWKSYIKTHEKAYDDLLEKYAVAEKRRKEIEQQAANERTQWQEVIEIFNARFVVPFTLKAKNYVDLVLGEKTGIDLGFTYHDGEDKDVEKSQLVDVLSMGERRALYILNVIFEIRTRTKLQKETLLVIDDIADSFDYQNKYAIIEYLKEVSETPIFKQIILTHNFDFFRTLQSRGVARYSACLTAQKTASGVMLEKAEGIKNPFVNDWKGRFFKDDLKKVASIPFLRNLIEFTKGEDEPNYLLLTSMVHWRPDTESLTVRDLDKVYCDVCGGSETSSSPGRMLVELIKAEAASCAMQSGSMALANKVVLAMGIRLAAEEYMVAKLADPPFWHDIKSQQTPTLLARFRKQFPEAVDAIDVLGRVVLMTPENIHLNSFMYEPILDMSPDNLCRLHHRVAKLWESS